jgi:cation:H+ antiporter
VLITAGQAFAGLVMLYAGGVLLVMGASGLAVRAGVSSLAIGLTVVAMGTSAPELVVSVDAALSGASDIAIGNIVGSNIANIGLILGLAALLHPMAVKKKVIRLDAPILIVVSLALIGVLADGQVTRLEGGLLLLGLVGYTVFTFWETRREPDPTGIESASKPSETPPAIPANLFRVLGGLLLLVGGGHYLVTSAVSLAGLLGLSQGVIGLTIVAVGTSLPELSTSLVASIRGQGDMAIGNVIGSNIYNILGILGVTSVLHPPGSGGITSLDLGVLLAFTVVSALLLTTRLRLERVEGALLLGGFLLYSGWLLAS